MKDFRLGDIRATTCTRASGYLHVTGTAVRMPVTVVRGADEGPVVLVTGGVHGGEYPGIEAAIRLARSLEPEQVRGTVVAVHPVSLPAFHARQQYLVPDDGKNLNRQFPGKACGTVSERMAWTLMEVARRADAWVDLHGGDIHEALVPFMIYSDVADPEVVAASRSMAEVYGIENVIASASVKGGTYSAAAAEGIPCILAEAGQVGQLDDESVAVHLRGCRNVLRHVGCLPGHPEPMGPVRSLRRFEWRFAGEDGCWYPSVRLATGGPGGSARRCGAGLLRKHPPGVPRPDGGHRAVPGHVAGHERGRPLLAVGAG